MAPAHFVRRDEWLTAYDAWTGCPVEHVLPSEIARVRAERLSGVRLERGTTALTCADGRLDRMALTSTLLLGGDTRFLVWVTTNRPNHPCVMIGVATRDGAIGGSVVPGLERVTAVLAWGWLVLAEPLFGRSCAQRFRAPRRTAPGRVALLGNEQSVANDAATRGRRRPAPCSTLARPRTGRRLSAWGVKDRSADDARPGDL